MEMYIGYTTLLLTIVVVIIVIIYALITKQLWQKGTSVFIINHKTKKCLFFVFSFICVFFFACKKLVLTIVVIVSGLVLEPPLTKVTVCLIVT